MSRLLDIKIILECNNINKQDLDGSLEELVSELKTKGVEGFLKHYRLIPTGILEEESTLKGERLRQIRDSKLKSELEGDKYNFMQLDVILDALYRGVDIELIMNPELDWRQMLHIMNALIHGIDIQLLQQYATPEFSWNQIASLNIKHEIGVLREFLSNIDKKKFNASIPKRNFHRPTKPNIKIESKLENSINKQEYDDVRYMCIEADYDFIPPLTSVMSIEKHMDEFEEDKVILAKVLGRTVGFLEYQEHEDCLYIHGIIVLKEYRGEGIAEKLYKEIDKFGEDIKIKTWSTNHAQLHLLNKLGYEKMNTPQEIRQEGIETVWFYKQNAEIRGKKI